ncbi:MAG: glycerol-3-phosphate dehydrogenase/oxidase, partial [Bacteroidota bacterium]
MDSRKRSEKAQKLQTGEFDLLVIGGGMTGAGIALDGASRGLKTALVEMQDFGAGTSSRSTKLIHGGLRYLKQFEIKLVREVGQERAILYANAPHIVIPEQMILPVMKGGTYGRFGLSIGLWIYDRLAKVRKDERRKMMSAERALRFEPLMRKDGLKSAGMYHEYRTDDARLVMEVMKTAAHQGAVCMNHVKATELIYEAGKIKGAKVEDRFSGEKYEIRAKVVVNAAGPWVDEVRKLDNSLKGKRLHHTKGVHLVVPHARLPLKYAVYFDIFDGRMMFAIPRGRWTYFGTTDTTYENDLVHPRVTRSDADYLLKAVNHMFPSVKLTDADVRSSWAGIRPLIHEDGKSPSELSRKDEIFYSETGLVTIAGGKLTGFRKMAERVT